MPSDKNDEVRINTRYLTKSGASTAPFCRVRVEGLNKLVSNYSSVHSLSADTSNAAKVWTQRSEPSVIGKEIAIVIDFEPEANASAIIADLEAQFAAGTDAEIAVTGFISITVSARVVYQSGAYFSWESRRGGNLKSARFSFICTGRIS